jgi:hypothetical protein
VITTAAAVIAVMGSKRFDKNGSAGISPFVKGYDGFSSDSISSNLTVSVFE